METSGNKLTQSLQMIVGLLLGMLVINADIKALPVNYAYFQLRNTVNTQGRSVQVDERYAKPLGDIIRYHAQSYRIPLDREKTKVEVNPSGVRISADYLAPIDLSFFQLNLPVQIQYPEHKRAASLAKGRTIAVIGLLLSLGWFFKGFLIYRKYRVVADTPLTSIRGIAMGLVQIRGKAVGEKTMLSPVSRLPCFLYKVNIERWTGKNGWSQYRTDAAWVSFYLEDETGRVCVNPRGAEFDIEQTGQREISRRAVMLAGDDMDMPERPVTDPVCFASDQELLRYIARVEQGMRTGHFQGADLSSPASVESEQSKSPAGIFQGLQSLNSSSLLSSGGQFAGGYRLTEHCIQSEYSYNITGTCAENSAVTNEVDHKIITKGRNSPTFLISNRTEKAIEGTLRSRALRYVFGGGLLAIGFATALLQSLGVL